MATYTPHITVCRGCKRDSSEVRNFKYGTRVYRCASCGFAKFGLSFLDRIPAHMVMQLPYRAVLGAGLTLEQAQDYVTKREAATEARRPFSVNEWIANK